MAYDVDYMSRSGEWQSIFPDLHTAMIFVHAMRKEGYSVATPQKHGLFPRRRG